MANLSSYQSKSAVLKNIPLMWLKEGQQQPIRLDQKKILIHVVTALGARSAPIFTEVNCPDDAVKYSVSLDLGFVQANHVATVEGVACINKFAAERSAVEKAFKYLYDECNISISDYSSRVMKTFAHFNTYGKVNEAMVAVVSVISEFEKFLGTCNYFLDLLKNKVEEEKHTGMISEDGLVYYSLSGIISSLVESSAKKVSLAKTNINHIESDRLEYYRNASDRFTETSHKVHVESYVLPAKELLQFVMSYFSFGTVKYSNTPKSDGTADAVAKFKVPRFKELKFCGNLRTPGSGSSSDEAEDDAAFNAIQFFEVEYKVKIVDLNHAERLEAEKIQNSLINMLDRIVVVGLDMKLIYFNLEHAIEEQHQAFRDEPISIHTTANGEAELCAPKVCAADLLGLLQQCQKSYEVCSVLFDRILKLSSELTLFKKKICSI